MKKTILSMALTSLMIMSSFTAYGESISMEDPISIIEGEEVLEEAHTNVLTYEAAVAKTLKQSYDHRSLMETIDQLEETRKQVASDLRYIPIGGQGDQLTIRTLLGLRTTEVNLQMTKRQEDTLKDMLAFKVRSEYDNIAKKIKEIQLQEKIIENTERQLLQLSQKSMIGTASNYEYQVQLNKYYEEKQKKATLEKELEDSYLKLNITMGIDRNERYDVVLERETEWMEDVNVNLHAQRMQSQHPAVWNQQQQIRLKELDVELHVFNVGDTPYQAKQAEVRKAQIQLSSLKENIEQSVKSTYNQMKQLQSQYELMQIMLQKAEKDLKMAQLRFDVGMGIALDVQMAEIAVTSIKSQMETILISYEQLRIIFEKPWVMG